MILIPIILFREWQVSYIPVQILSKDCLGAITKSTKGKNANPIQLTPEYAISQVT